MALILIGKEFKPQTLAQLEHQFASKDQLVIIHDTDKCIACYRCVISCKILNNAAPGQMPARISKIGPLKKKSGKLRVINLGFRCVQCDQPMCVYSCPAGVLKKNGKGVIYQKWPERCVGCQICVLVCPHMAIEYNYEKESIVKCDLCIKKIGNDELPSCVQGCIMNAISYGPVRTLNTLIKNNCVGAIVIK